MEHGNVRLRLIVRLSVRLCRVHKADTGAVHGLHQTNIRKHNIQTGGLTSDF